MSEEYSIEWFKEIKRDNPKWLGTQAFKLMEHYIALEAKLSKMEEFRVLLDEFQQEAQTRWKDYAPEMINARIIKLKEALAGGEEA